MAISFVQKRKTQKYLVLVFVILAIGIVFIFLSGYFGQEELSISEPFLPPETFPKININFQALENSVFLELQSFPEIPTTSMEEFGRENPFLPCQKESPVSTSTE